MLAGHPNQLFKWLTRALNQVTIAQLPSMAAVHVHIDVGKVELAQSVCSKVLVIRCRPLALGNPKVCHHVTQRVGL
jgi:hypothetical protein